MKKILLLHISMILMTICAFSQEFTVNFTGRLNGFHYQRIDSVWITDITRNWTETLVYPDTVIAVNTPVNISNNEMFVVGFGQNVPNPFDCYTSVELSIPQDENVKLQLFDAAGKQCAALNVALNAGSHKFEITAAKPQAYILKAIAGTKTYSVRMINVGSCGSNGIKYGGYVGLCTKLTIDNEFQVGDDMEFVGYATIDDSVVESETVSHPLMENQDIVLEFSRDTTGTLNGHDRVDLGLQSGTRWATCNVGAETPDAFGDYFAWGEVQTKARWSWEAYIYTEGGQQNLTKYCYDSLYGYCGYTDTLITLEPMDDAATYNWGSNWRIPKNSEFQELIDYCSHERTTQNGVNGWLFTGPNGYSIFLPAAGVLLGNIVDEEHCNYWTSTLVLSGHSIYAFKFWDYVLDLENWTTNGMTSDLRYKGLSVRPVCAQ